MQFRAFISYSHADATVARWLLRRLETYRVPTRLVGTHGAHGQIGPRLGAFFRDRDELPSSGDLGATIRAALAASEALVVICSPAAAQSRWVNAEIEAFRAGGHDRQLLCFVVAGEPGSGDPARACFPPALLDRATDGTAIEPLAADARRTGDGRERAFLKLVAGLLGVGFDSLARREAQRRQRRMLAVAVAALAGMTIALGLAATAWIARNDAQRRQAQAEDLLGFMLGDLRDKLETVGRLDLMRVVDAKATTYFAALRERDLGDAALAQQARSLTGIGEVRLEEGNHRAALAAFREAHRRAVALVQRRPSDGQRIFDRAQVEYWLGLVAWRQGDLDTAGQWLHRYRDSAYALVALNAHKPDWQREVAYGHHNLAVLAESRGHYAEAERAFRDELRLYDRWLQQAPNDTQLRFEAANVVSWLGSMAARQGRLAEAETLFADEVRREAENRRIEPDNAAWQVQWVDALGLLGEVQLARGRRDPARASFARAHDVMRALVAHDPSNRSWQQSLAHALWWRARLDATTAAADATTAAAEAERIFAAAVAAEPDDEGFAYRLADVRVLLARLALGSDAPNLARMWTARARAGLGRFGSGRVETRKRTDPIRRAYAELGLIDGEIAQRQGDRVGATAAWEQATTELAGLADRSRDWKVLDPWARLLIVQGREPQAHAVLQRLRAIDYAPLTPWPVTATPLAHEASP